MDAENEHGEEKVVVRIEGTGLVMIYLCSESLDGLDFPSQPP